MVSRSPEDLGAELSLHPPQSSTEFGDLLLPLLRQGLDCSTSAAVRRRWRRARCRRGGTLGVGGLRGDSSSVDPSTALATTGCWFMHSRARVEALGRWVAANDLRVLTDENSRAPDLGDAEFAVPRHVERLQRRSGRAVAALSGGAERIAEMRQASDRRRRTIVRMLNEVAGIHCPQSKERSTATHP